MILLAFRAPGNIEYAVAHIQNLLFQEFSMVSSIALPPLVPLSFAENTMTEEIRLPPLPAGAQPGRITYKTDAYFMENRSLFLGLSPYPVFEAAHPWGREGIFPVARGFYLGEIPDDRAPEDMLRILPEKPKLAWSGGYLSCMELDVQAPLSVWWEYISWKVKLKKKV